MCGFFFVGHQFAPSKHSDPRDPGLPGKRPGGKGPEETLQPGAEESAAGRVPQGEFPQSLFTRRIAALRDPLNTKYCLFAPRGHRLHVH